MPSPAPALLQLQHQINERWPRRSRASDGIMGDWRHRLRRSAHNDGDALDVTNDRSHGPNLDLMVNDFCRQMRRNPDGGRLALMIWRRRIFLPPYWEARPYHGANPHESHAHLEVRHELRAVTRPWTVHG